MSLKHLGGKIFHFSFNNIKNSTMENFYIKIIFKKYRESLHFMG